MKYLALLALLPSVALATPPHKPAEPPKAEANASAVSGAYANSEANSASESVSSADNSVVFSQRRQAPAAFSPSISPSAPCYYSHSAGVSVPGFGASGGKALKDEACENRENIRLAYQMGLQVEADYLFCQSIGKDIPNCGKRPVVVCEEKDCLTQDDLAERWKRIQEKSLAK